MSADVLQRIANTLERIEKKTDALVDARAKHGYKSRAALSNSHHETRKRAMAQLDMSKREVSPYPLGTSRGDDSTSERFALPLRESL